MSDDFTVRIDASEFRRFIDRKGDFGGFIRKSLERSGDAGEVIMMKHAPKRAGRLAQSISAKLVRDQLEIAPRLNSIYPTVMITGTRPFTPPWSPIERWARRKGLPAGAVWMSIKKRGIQSADESKHRVDYAHETREEMKDRVPKIFNDELKNWIRM